MIRDSGKSKLLKLYNCKGMRVRQLLEELGLSEEYFVVLVDGKRVNLDSYIDEDGLVIVLPRIAGG